MQLAQNQRTPVLRLLCLATLTFLIGGSDAKSQTSLHEMKGGESGSHTLAFSPDGKVLAGFEYFRKKRMMAVVLWDLKTATVKRTLKVPHQVWALAFSPDGKTLATGSGGQFSGYIKLWDVQTGKLKRNLASGYFTANKHVGDIGPVYALAFSPNGKTIAMGAAFEGEMSTGGEVLLLDTGTGKTIRKLKMPSYAVTALAFSSSGRLVAAACDDGRIRLCSTKTGKLIRTTAKQSGDISAVRFTSDGKSILSAAQDQTVRIWNVKRGTLTRTITKVGGDYRFSPHGFAISKDGGTVAVGGEDVAVRLARIK